MVALAALCLFAFKFEDAEDDEDVEEFEDNELFAPLAPNIGL
jgi:hypothetical protein